MQPTEVEEEEDDDLLDDDSSTDIDGGNRLRPGLTPPTSYISLPLRFERQRLPLHSITLVQKLTVKESFLALRISYQQLFLSRSSSYE